MEQLYLTQRYTGSGRKNKKKESIKQIKIIPEPFIERNKLNRMRLEDKQDERKYEMGNYQRVEKEQKLVIRRQRQLAKKD